MNTERETPGFDREWITVGEHRVLLRQRDGAPGQEVRQAALVAAWTLQHALDCEQSARLVEVFHDNRHTSGFSVVIGSDEPGTPVPLGPIRVALEVVFDGYWANVERVDVEPGDKSSDRYDHTAHIVRSVLKADRREAYLA